jgi:glutamate dehydrogenase
MAYTKHDPNVLTIDLENVTTQEMSKTSGGKKKEGAVWIHTSQPGVSATEGPGSQVEKK